MRFLLLFLFCVNVFAAMPAVDLSTVPVGVPGSVNPLIRDAVPNVTPTEYPKFDINNIKLRFLCKFAKAGNFDPIVAPGQAVFGHHHTFFGNTGVTGLSTPGSILNSGGSTCAGGSLFRSAMWMPSVVDGVTGKYIKPKQLIVYYVGAGSTMSRDVNTIIPDGLRMIAGNHLNALPFDASKAPARFVCGNDLGTSGYTPGIPICSSANRGYIRAFVAFPQCIKVDANGNPILDSTDHKSHLAYRKTGNYLQNQLKNECPTSHPKRIPEIALHFDFDIAKNGYSNASTWRLSSDNYDYSSPGGYSLHADYMIGMDQLMRQMMLDNCHKPMNDCGMGNIGVSPVDGKYKKLVMPTVTELGE